MKKEDLMMLRTLKTISTELGRAYRSALNEIIDITEKTYMLNFDGKKIAEILQNKINAVFEYEVSNTLSQFYNSAYTDAIARNLKQYKFKYNFSQIDKTAVDQFSSNNNWFTSKYFELTDKGMVIEQMRELWKSGEQIDDAVKEIKKIMADSNKRALKYSKTTILTNNTRIRTTADLNSFNRNEIKTYRFNALLDNVTTDTCRELNGREYSVQDALARQNEDDQNVQDIIQNDQKKGKADWQIYNDAMKHLQKNNALAVWDEDKQAWKSEIILRTSNPEIQGKKITKLYSKLEKVPGNDIPRPALHFNCRSRLNPVF